MGLPGRLPPPARARTVVLAATLILALLGAAAARAGTGELRRVGAVPRLPQGASGAGSLAGATLVPVTVALRPRDPTALEAYATGVSTAGSPLYRHFLSVPEFAARFAPLAAQRRAVRSALGAV